VRPYAAAPPCERAYLVKIWIDLANSPQCFSSDYHLRTAIACHHIVITSRDFAQTLALADSMGWSTPRGAARRQALDEHHPAHRWRALELSKWARRESSIEMALSHNRTARRWRPCCCACVRYAHGLRAPAIQPCMLPTGEARDRPCVLSRQIPGPLRSRHEGREVFRPEGAGLSIGLLSITRLPA
jgi:hypothetical protein